MIIDFHTHAFPEQLADRAIGKLASTAQLIPEYRGTLDSLVAKMDEWHIDSSVVLNIATNPKQMTNVNNFAIATKSEYGDRLYPLGSVHPDSDYWDIELERIKVSGLVGVKLHPDYMQTVFDSPKFTPILELASELELFVIIHAGFDVISPDLIHATPEMIARVKKRHPKLKLVAAHFGANKMWNEVYSCLAGEDVYIDTSLATVYGLDKSLAEKILNKHDPDKVLFGSDAPWGSAARARDYIDSLAISDDAKEKIFSINALRLLAGRS